MTFQTMELRLRKQFDNNRAVWDRFIKFRDNAHKTPLIIDQKKNLIIRYPGYKSNKQGNRYVYDYRVDYKGHAISHPNIIVDLYNKAKQCPELGPRLTNFLTILARDGDSTNLEDFTDLLAVEFNPPPEDIIIRVNNTFDMLGKSYLKKGNLPWNFPLEDLALLISWICLQEDINYPMSVGRLQGRMMPFFRYLEAVYCGLLEEEEGGYTLEMVIERSVNHYQPQPWDVVNYEGIKRLKHNAQPRRR